jgi:large subunit ribosomal protein L35
MTVASVHGSTQQKDVTSIHRIDPRKGKEVNKEEAMPKMKTKSGAKKRFKLTGTGKIKRKHAFKNHILTKKETKRKRGLQKMTLVHKADEKNIRDLLK